MTSGDQPPLVAVVGPTGVGKTRVSIDLCQEVDGEIVSADSRQIYRHMDIGTAKPTTRERSLVPHHLVDIVDTDDSFTLAQYQRLAYQAIDDILDRRKVPFVVGGTGLYVRAVLEGFVIPRVEPEERLRERLRMEAVLDGGAALHARLEIVDPEAAAKINPRNVRRVIRALEVYETLGRPISSLQDRKPPPYLVLKIGLTMDREELYGRLDQRVERMIDNGLVAEVKGLLEAGYSPDLPAMSGLGYRQICGYLRGETDLATAVSQIKSETHRFVRQQYKWFRPDDQSIHWFDVSGEASGMIMALVVGFLEKSG